MHSDIPSRPSRLSPTSLPEDLAPFVRAAEITDVSLYWMPIKEFPVLPRQRGWILEFLKRLGPALKASDGLREENFLPFKSLYPDYLDRFTQMSVEYLPLSGISLAPDTKPTNNPTFEEIKNLIEEGSKSGKPIDVNQFVPDILYWFLMKRGEEQRQDFWGGGGMITLYLKPDMASQAPKIHFPKVITSRPDFDKGMEGKIQATYSMKDSFLQKSKELFGKPFEKLPMYQGLRFILPILSSSNLMNVAAAERERYLQLFDGMFIESKADHGMLMMMKNPLFDDQLFEILQSMLKDGHEYPIS